MTHIWFLIFTVLYIYVVVFRCLITGKEVYDNATHVSLSDVCDPSMRNMHNGVIISGFVFSFLAVVLTGAAVWHHVYRHRGEEL